MTKKSTNTVRSIAPADNSSQPHVPVPGSELIKVPLAAIDFDDMELCFRINLKIDDLIEDIKKNGQQVPVIIRASKIQKNRYQIVSGFRRCNSLRELNLTFVNAVIREDLDDDDKAYQVSYIENEKRKNLTGIDKAQAIAKLSIKGKSPEEVKELFGIGERQYYRYKKAMDFPSTIKDAIADRFIKITHGLALMEAYEGHSREMDLDEWVDWIIEENASISQLKNRIRTNYGKTNDRNRNYIEMKQSGGFRLSPFVFDPRKTDGDSVNKIMASLKEALVLLENWSKK